ncbi:MAG: UDP-4-amino-4,6-dideoxy-N-acetyl-beta-L-altrosamine transaminase [Pseudomonadota bacterium]
MSAGFIPYGRQSIDDADVAAVVEVLRSDWLTQGPAIERFESAVAEYTGARHACAVANATAALHLACLALELGPGKRLWTSPNTFLASANCGRYCGAEVDFVDIDPRSYNLSVERLEEKLARAARENRLPHVLVTVDFAGQPCEADRIAELARHHGVRIIDDASHAIGATWKGERVGSGRWADITVFSFHPVKILTTGEGGVALANDAELHRRVAMLRTHGMVRDAAHLECKDEGGWYYEQQALGFNYRMTDLQAALGLSQLRRIDAFLTARRRLAARYDRLLAGSGLTLPWQHPDALSSYHLYPIQLPDPALRREIFDGLRAVGIGVQVHYIPVHLQPYYRRLGFKAGDFPAAEAYYERAISLPMYAALTDAQQDFVVEQLLRLLRV